MSDAGKLSHWKRVFQCKPADCEANKICFKEMMTGHKRCGYGSKVQLVTYMLLMPNTIKTTDNHNIGGGIDELSISSIACTTYTDCMEKLGGQVLEESCGDPR